MQDYDMRSRRTRCQHYFTTARASKDSDMQPFTMRGRAPRACFMQECSFEMRRALDAMSRCVCLRCSVDMFARKERRVRQCTMMRHTIIERHYLFAETTICPSRPPRRHAKHTQHDMFSACCKTARVQDDTPTCRRSFRHIWFFSLIHVYHHECPSRHTAAPRRCRHWFTTPYHDCLPRRHNRHHLPPRRCHAAAHDAAMRRQHATHYADTMTPPRRQDAETFIIAR